jgi:uncharacterized membrane protein
VTNETARIEAFSDGVFSVAITRALYFASPPSLWRRRFQ